MYVKKSYQAMMLRVVLVLLTLASAIIPATAILEELPVKVFCEGGWTEFSLDTGSGTICLQFNTEARSWPDAEKHCGEHIANLMQLDLQNKYFTFTNVGTRMEVGNVLVETLRMKEFWSGMHVQNRRLMWDDYGPQYVSSEQYAWTWDEGQPDPSFGKCGKVTAGTTETRSELKEVPVEFYNNQMTIALHDCSNKLPFICQKNPVRLELKTASFCETNWIGNQFLPHCYRVFKDAESYEDAVKVCLDNEARLVVARTANETSFVAKAFEFFNKTDQYFSNKKVDQLWVANPKFNCSKFYTLRRSVVPADDCLSPNLFICTKPTRYVDDSSFEIEGPFLNPDSLLDFQPFEPLPLTGKLHRTLQEGEIAFLETPTAILNSTHNYEQTYHWSRVFYEIITSDIKLAPYYVTVSLGTGGENRAKRRKRQEGEVYVNFRDVYMSTGLYSFGLYNINPPVPYKASPPVLVRYSEADLFIYVLYLAMHPYPDGRLPVNPEAANKFNMMKDINDIPPIAQAANCILNTCEDMTWSGYAGHVESISNATVKFRLFVRPQYSRLVPTMDLDQKVMHTLKLKVLGLIDQETEYDGLKYRFWDNSSVVLRSTVSCPRLEMQVDRKVSTFPATRIEETGYSWERCYPDNKALATADCTGSYETGAVWGKTLFATGCGTVPGYNQSSSTSSLKDLAETAVDEDNYIDILRNTVNLTVPDVNVTEADVIYTADILSNLHDADLKINDTVLSSVLKITNNMLFTDRAAINNAQKITNAANRIVKSVDDLTNRIELPPLIDRDNSSASFVEDYIASEVWQQSGDGRVVIGFSVDSDSDRKIKPGSVIPLANESELRFNQTNAAIYLTENLVKGYFTKLSFHVYSKWYLFSDSSNRYVVQSSVVAARLTRNNREVRDLGNEFVTAVFNLSKTPSNLVCAFWDYNANEAAGGWRTDGCNLTRDADDDDDDDNDDGDVIVCKCNHLTNFAVLVDLKANSQLSETDKLALSIITKIGLILSIIGLGLTILTFLIFKHLRNGRGQQVLVNLSVSMLCSAILFLVGMDRTSSYGGCIAVAVLLHYFILVSFMWMLVEGVLQYLRFVKVLGTYIPNFMMKSMIPAWGIPLIPVIVILAVDYDMYYGGKGYCWLSRDPMIYGFIIPVAVIILANIIVFTMVMCNLFRRKNKNMASNQSERKMAFLHFQAAVSIFFILGLTWVFGFLTVDDTRIVFHYLFAIFNAFQGLCVFLLFTAREKQIQNAWRKLCCGRSQYKATSSGSDDTRRKHSNGDTNSTGLSKSDKGLDLSTTR
ncbi:uncharacterized protein LOC127848548 [Dreissena polymorpha]|uniref:Uncharacterized protein n=1 Tax=Dreissena polymorpha TaxID=45954 RepID=A0A9D4DQQ4_DREPO|nr:uncharacterized protein LOC127848548 [Dreissena polymorpha]KAH3752392.1 hypothetical protein DPMN_187009 [Dreissena polymorpha]